ncbi:ABC transporter ATP-binding protein [Effusibacillus pohliae]|uniref:ABC transporter ATP-binding protein n=1 Tax=Effusibacillus pohliae TaxID=232270 RepID=UPI00036674A5|nr:ABC transporter ATP-binding protein [Effusibacillus pohliae]
MIRLENICKRYRTEQGNVTALENINLSVERGEFLTIMGPSGSGKSTLLSLIGLLSCPTCGRLFVDGREASRLSDREKTDFRGRKFGFVFQFPSLVSTLTARENVLLPKLFAGKIKPADWRRADALLEQVGLAEKMHRRSHELSGGEQRRVALARALINDPDVVLADEPTGGLDAETGQRMMEMLRDIRQLGKTVLVVTHDRELAMYGDRVIRLRKGRMDDGNGTFNGETGEVAD